MYMFSVWMNNKIRVFISVDRFEIVNLAKWEFLQNSTHYHINMYITNDSIILASNIAYSFPIVVCNLWTRSTSFDVKIVH